MLPSSDALLMLHAEPDLRVLAFSIVASFVTRRPVRRRACAARDGIRRSRNPQRRIRRRGWRRAILQAAQDPGRRTDRALVPASGRRGTVQPDADTPQTHRHRNTVDREPHRLRREPREERLHRSAASSVLRRPARPEVRATPDVESAAYTWIPLLQGWAPGWHMRVEGLRPPVMARTWRSRTTSSLQGTGRRWAYGSTRAATSTSAIASIRRTWGRSRPSRSSIDGLPSDSSARGAPSADGIGVGEHAGALGIRIVGVVEDSLYAGPEPGSSRRRFSRLRRRIFPSRQRSTFARARNPPRSFPSSATLSPGSTDRSRSTG